KYLWFFASTDFGLKSQWLDMTNYPFNENFGLYMAVLSKKESSPLLPESDEDKGIQAAPVGNRQRPDGGSDTTSGDTSGSATAPNRARGPVTVAIDWDGLSKRIISVPGVPERQYSDLHTGADGTVFYLQAGQNQAGPGGGGSELIRYKLSDRKTLSYV